MGPLGEEGLTLEGRGLLSSRGICTCLQADEGSNMGEIAQNSLLLLDQKKKKAITLFKGQMT